MTSHSRWLLAMIATLSTSAIAAVSPEEAKQLSTTLTPWGAEKVGNKDGTIPAFTGEPIKLPSGFDPKTPWERPTPWDDKVLFSITAQNLNQYADKLSDGEKEMFKKYPKFRMDIFQSRRTANYPKYVQENSIKNATSCKAIDDESKLEGCYGGVPFPIPKSGTQVMWNHLVRYEQHSWFSNFGSYVVSSSGTRVQQAVNDGFQQADLFDPKRNSPMASDSVYFRARLSVTGPSRRVGEELIFYNGLNNTSRVWLYVPGQRRVKLAPDIAYDTPNPQSGGSYNQDDTQLFFGMVDRFAFKLAGKKELYIPYNTFKASSTKECPAAVLYQPGFANPDCVRWELHRVWAVQGTLKPGFRHNYQKRSFYFDEDMPGAGTADNFDASGRLYRVSFVYPYPFYEGDGMSASSYMVNDLATGSYAGAGFPEKSGWHARPTQATSFYSPEALAGQGVR